MRLRASPIPISALRRLPLIQVRRNASLGGGDAAGAHNSVISVQQIPAPGAGFIRVLLLNRPEARNALSRQLLNSLGRYVDAITAEGGDGPTRALVLASNVDAAFCAGADLKERAKFTREEWVALYKFSSASQFTEPNF
jgi:methylglutaconyl-CoA hydratase